MISFKEYIDVMSEGYHIDINDNSHITHRNNNYFFKSGDIDYIVTFYNANTDKEGYFSVKFGPNKNSKIGSIDMIEGLPMSVKKDVMSNVAKSIVMFIKQYKPIALHYNVDTNSRHKAYLRLVNILLMKRDVMGYHIDNKENNFFIIRNDYDIGSIF